MSGASGPQAGAAPPRATPPPAPATEGPKSSGKYRLLGPHVIGDCWLPTGTEVGTDTPYPFPGHPSTQMEGLDDAGKAAVDAIHQALYGVKAPWTTPNPTMDQYKPVPDAKSDSVSLAQAAERGEKEYQGKVVPVPLPQPSQISLSGDHSITLGAPLETAVLPPPPRAA